MALYKLSYRNSVETMEAKNKADAIKQYRKAVAPTATLKELTRHVLVEKVKVVRVVTIKCAICDEQVPRKEFVDHVRRH